MSIPFFVQGQIGSVHFIDTSLETAGITQIASADVDNDGKKDIITSSTGNAGRLGYYQNLSNNSFSSFKSIVPLAFCRGLAIGDFNKDNWQDIVSISGTNNDVRIHLNITGNFGPAFLLDSANPTQLNDVVVADFDGNKWDDIVVIGQHSIDLYRNDGSGNFTKELILSTSTSSKILECLDLATADIDKDGDMDLICGESAGLVIYLNNGMGVFSPRYYSIMAEIYFLVHPFDVDNDGDLDIVGRNSAGDVKWFSNDGNGRMNYEATLSNVPNLVSLSSVDYNMDGYEDLYVSYTKHISIFKNDSNHAFSTEIPVYQNDNRLMGPVQVADMDGIGALDMVWSGGNNGLAYLINESPTPINGIGVESNVIFPNPTKGIIHLNRPSEKLLVYNVLGKRVLELSNEVQCDLSSYPSGIYMVVTMENGRISQQRIVKQ